MDSLKKLLSDKKFILFFALVGIVIMLIGGVSDKKEPSVTEATPEEQRLMNILSHIDGAGEVRVMITSADQKGSAFSTDNENTYQGAVILAEGGEKSVVKEKIIKAVQAVTGLDIHRIVVYRLDTSSKQK